MSEHCLRITESILKCRNVVIAINRLAWDFANRSPKKATCEDWDPLKILEQNLLELCIPKVGWVIYAELSADVPKWWVSTTNSFEGNRYWETREWLAPVGIPALVIGFDEWEGEPHLELDLIEVEFPASQEGLEGRRCLFPLSACEYFSSKLPYDGGK